MQLSPDHGDVDHAIAELERAVSIAALCGVIKTRQTQHKPTGVLRRRLELLRAIQIAEEIRA